MGTRGPKVTQQVPTNARVKKSVGCCKELFRRSDQVMLATADVAAFALPLEDYSLGLPFGKRLSDGRIILHQELITLRGSEATKNVMHASEEDVQALLDGKDIPCDPSLRGHVILLQGNIAVGHGLARDGTLKNNLPRWMILR